LEQTLLNRASEAAMSHLSPYSYLQSHLWLDRHPHLTPAPRFPLLDVLRDDEGLCFKFSMSEMRLQNCRG